jgi:hypothetical protein
VPKNPEVVSEQASRVAVDVLSDTMEFEMIAVLFEVLLEEGRLIATRQVITTSGGLAPDKAVAEALCLVVAQITTLSS